MVEVLVYIGWFLAASLFFYAKVKKVQALEGYRQNEELKKSVDSVFNASIFIIILTVWLVAIVANQVFTIVAIP